MQTASLNLSQAQKIYPTATDEIKKFLEQSFGKEIYTDITQRVQTFQDVLDISGITMDELVSEKDTVDEKAYKMAKLIAKVYNEGTELDPMDTTQYKYYPWHKIQPGSGLSCFDFGYWSTGSPVGVRLCFKSEALAEDAGKKFIDIYTNLKIK